ncbi:hypothetical protein JB92DRAFT_3249442 [Gautieria morchelliformis]|nr:hypothetical protein JB92DRAFT_3249442 [Gautieria morchelliformis]
MSVNGRDSVCFRLQDRCPTYISLSVFITPLASLSHLTPDDQHTFLRNSIAPRRSVPFPVVHHTFEHQVQLQSHAVTVEHTLFDHALTYEQLDKQVDHLAHCLRDKGISPGYRVCILA